jgi:cysteine-rich repeat protein
VAAGGSLVLHAYFAPDCGNGSLDGDEDCDDGNSLDGDCCASDCTFEPSGSPCDDFDLCSEVDSCDGAGSCDGSVVTDCTDGDLCTQDTCLGGGSCANDFVPAVMCKTSAKAALQVKDDANDTKDQVKWRWQKGAFVTDLELGSPAVDTDYTLCVYDETASVPALYMGRTIPGGSAAWVDKGPGKGVQYKDKLGTSDGFVKVQVRPGSSGKSKAQVRLKGAGLALPGPNAGSEYFDQDPRITVQLINELGVCWTSEFTPAGTKRNDSSQFNAKAP